MKEWVKTKVSSHNFFSDPKFPFDEDFRHEDDWSDNNSCPNCEKPLSEHSPKELLKCSLEVIGGVPH